MTAEPGPVPAELTTQEAEALGIREEISSFTTNISNPRSGENIRVVAAEVDGALVVESVDDDAVLREAHAAGRPVVARAADAAGITRALSRPEVSCVLVTDPALLELDLPELTYG